MTKQEMQDRLDALCDKNRDLGRAANNLLNSDMPEAQSLGKHLVNYQERVDNYKQSLHAFRADKSEFPSSPVDQLPSYSKHCSNKSHLIENVGTMADWMDYADLDVPEEMLESRAVQQRMESARGQTSMGTDFNRERFATSHERDLKAINDNWQELMVDAPELDELKNMREASWDLDASEKMSKLERDLGLIHPDDTIDFDELDFGGDSRG
ncbi:MAG: hypothetical protein VX730_03555 [Pseudomonadota bacterium]|nr:hypothetical protein [Pseudomonadota bacterium]